MVVMADGRRGSFVRALIYGGATALVGAGAIVVLGGVFAVSAGLLVIAVALGYATGVAVTIGAGAEASTSATTRRALAVGWVAGGVVLGLVGLWWYAAVEGGTLGLIDHLGQVYGILTPLLFVGAIAVAWWNAH
jgi:hypothetical protein